MSLIEKGNGKSLLLMVFPFITDLHLLPWPSWKLPRNPLKKSLNSWKESSTRMEKLQRLSSLPTSLSIRNLLEIWGKMEFLKVCTSMMLLKNCSKYKKWSLMHTHSSISKTSWCQQIRVNICSMFKNSLKTWFQLLKSGKCSTPFRKRLKTCVLLLLTQTVSLGWASNIQQIVICPFWPGTSIPITLHWPRSIYQKPKGCIRQ